MPVVWDKLSCLASDFHTAEVALGIEFDPFGLPSKHNLPGGVDLVRPYPHSFANLYQPQRVRLSWPIATLLRGHRGPG